ncbi:MAG TPA: phage terminase large subunit [Polyangia bacterium]|nr:phage terminase large subunit [Polyangia bacterium]
MSAPADERSALDRMIAALGPTATRAELQRTPLQSFTEIPLPEGWASASAWDALGSLWALNARRSQLIGIDGPHRIVLLRSGRGYGKSRCGAETTNLVAQRLWRFVREGKVQAPARIILCGRADADTRDTMVLGASGVVARSAPWFPARHEPGRRRVVWADGAVEALTYSASEPSQTRGPDACWAWCDETASWGAHLEEAWNNITLATRVGPLVTRVLCTTTPRDIPWIRALVERTDVLDVKRSTRDNERNLSPGLVADFYQRFAGAVAAQELNGEIVSLSGESWFPRENATVLEAAPNDIMSRVRSWDFAGTKPSEASPDPDWSVGTLLGRRSNGAFVILHAALLRDGPGAVEDLVARTAEIDGRDVPVLIPVDPGAAGLSAAAALARRLAGFNVHTERPTGSKESRATAFSAQWQHGNVAVMRGAWNEELLKQLAGFPLSYEHDDGVDSASSGFNFLCVGVAPEYESWAGLVQGRHARPRPGGRRW